MNKKNLLKILLLGAIFSTGTSCLTSCNNSKPEDSENQGEKGEEEKQDEETIIDATSVELDKKTLTIEEGLNALLKCTVLPSDATNKKVTWSSTDETIVTVSKAGVVHALKEGEATIKATHEEGWVDKCTVIVTKHTEEEEHVLISILLDKTEFSLIRGEEQQLVATLLPETLEDKSLTWNSTNPLVATVSPSGKVTAVGEGTATIIVSHGVYTSTCSVTVLKENLTFNDLGKVSLLNEVVGEYLSLTSPLDEYNFLKEHTNLKSSDPENDYQGYVLDWEDDGSSEYRIVISNNQDLSKPLVDKMVTTSEYNFGLYTPGETYYTLITNENNDTIEAIKYTINPNEVRFVNVPKIKNARDFGGWSVGEDNINYKLLYRGGCLNGKGAGKLNDEGIEIFNNDLKMKTEIDFRAYNSDGSGYQSEAFFDKDANYVTVDLKEKRFDDVIKDASLKNSIKTFFTTLSKKENYPIYMHCNEGASRTGTGAFLVEALLGVSYEDMVRDYELTNFSQSGSRRWRTHAYNEEVGFIDLTSLSYDELRNTTPNPDTGRSNCGYNIDAMYAYLMDNYKGTGTTIQDAVTNYLLDCGVTNSEIESFKDIMFTDGMYDEIVKEDETEEDKSLVFVTLTGITENGEDVIVPMQKGTKLDVSTPKLPQKFFDDWYLEDGSLFDAKNTQINENITLVAHWKECSEVVTDNKITVFELDTTYAAKMIGSNGKVIVSDDTIEFYELKNSNISIELPKIKFSDYKIVEFDVMNNWAKAFLSFGSSNDDLVQFGVNTTRYRYTIRVDCETGKMYVARIFNVANGSVVSQSLTEIGYTLNTFQLNGLTPLLLNYNSSEAKSFGFKLTSAFTYIK